MREIIYFIFLIDNFMSTGGVIKERSWDKRRGTIFPYCWMVVVTTLLTCEYSNCELDLV
jgi:hypothetical protein